MHLIRLILFITALFCTNDLIQAKATTPSTAVFKDYVKYLLNVMGVENEYMLFLTYMKVYSPEDSKLKALYNEYFSHDAYMSDLTEIYMNYYTLEDVMKLIDFYSSPLGKKTLRMNHDVNKQMEDIMLNKISDYIFTSTEQGFDIILPQIP
ncbi:hypothetical protein I4U23_020612 [Adineta vaga]|nr:hypothetical protein I4U23_020612 [Adineta vaga]